MNNKPLWACIAAGIVFLWWQGTARAAYIDLAAVGSFHAVVAGPKTHQWLQNNDEVTDAVLLWGDAGCTGCDLTSRLIFDGLGSGRLAARLRTFRPRWCAPPPLSMRLTQLA